MTHGKYAMAAFALAVGVIGGLLTSVAYIGLSEGVVGSAAVATMDTSLYTLVPPSSFEASGVCYKGRPAIMLTWSSFSGNNINYSLYRDGSTSATYTGIGGLVFYDNGSIVPGSNHSYRIAVNRYDQTSVLSYIVSATAPSSCDATSVTPSAPTIGAAPKIASAISACTQTGMPFVVVSWSSVSTATGYKIFRDGVQVGAVGSSITSYTDVGVGIIPGNQYTYTVKTVSSSGESAASNAVASNPVQGSCPVINPTALPTTPTGVTAASACASTPRVVVSWNAVPGATKYKVFKNDAITPQETNQLAIVDISVSPNQRISYKVKASNSIGDSSASTPVISDVILVGPCVAPVVSTATSQSCGNKVEVSWTAGVTMLKTAYYAVYKYDPSGAYYLEQALYRGPGFKATIALPQPDTKYDIVVIPFDVNNSVASVAYGVKSAYSSAACGGQAFNYSLLNGGNITVTKSSSVSVNGVIGIVKNLISGGSQPVTLAVSGLPAGVTLSSISNNPGSLPSNSTVTVSVSPATIPGTYPVTVKATALGGLTKITSFSLTIVAPAGTTTSPTPTIPPVSTTPVGVPTISSVTPNPGTNTYTIRGTNLTGARVVRVYRTATSELLITQEEITAVTPTSFVFKPDNALLLGFGPGNYKITVATPGGNSARADFVLGTPTN